MSCLTLHQSTLRVFNRIKLVHTEFAHPWFLNGPESRCDNGPSLNAVDNKLCHTVQLTHVSRTHMCGDLCSSHSGKLVSIAGWLEHKRGNKFFTLRDTTGNVQILVDCEGVRLPAKESVIAVQGQVQLRPDGNVNTAMKTGEIEVVGHKIDIVNECRKLPFPINDFSVSKESLRMKYRYIDLRSKMLQRNLRLRSSFLLKIRNLLCEEHGFVDVETPSLFKKTPGGAQEFLVPTQKRGLFYSLPQSPQQFKQLLMVGAIDRYMQIARCFRDEGARPDRQPEFTQLDIEMSFVNQEHIKRLIEKMMLQCWPKELNQPNSPFLRMTYKEAMENYGSDKPDVSFGCKIKDLTKIMKDVTIFQDILSSDSNVVKAIHVANGTKFLTPADLKVIQQSIDDLCSVEVITIPIQENLEWKTHLNKTISDDIRKSVNDLFDTHPGDILLVCANDSIRACTALGKCRNIVAQRAILKQYPLFDNEKFTFVWVEDFPLFESVEDATCTPSRTSLQSVHHPFTAPADEDIDLLYTNPELVRSQHYDLVLNGYEVGGGSIRVHNADMQRHIIDNILKEDSSLLEHLLEALDSGCPPHGGIALGLDRLLAVMCGANSIRDVIAFPKSSDGSDPMTDAPCAASKQDLDLYKISVDQIEK